MIGLSNRSLEPEYLRVFANKSLQIRVNHNSHREKSNLQRFRPLIIGSELFVTSILIQWRIYHLKLVNKRP